MSAIRTIPVAACSLFRTPNAPGLGQLLHYGRDGGRDPDRVVVRRHHARRRLVYAPRSGCHPCFLDANAPSFRWRAIRVSGHAASLAGRVAGRDHSGPVWANRPWLPNSRHPQAAQGAAKLLTKDEARRMAANFAKLLGLLAPGPINASPLSGPMPLSCESRSGSERMRRPVKQLKLSR